MKPGSGTESIPELFDIKPRKPSRRGPKSWEYISRRGVFFKEFWMIFPRHEICSPCDDIVSKILSRRGDCIGIHAETRSNIQRPFDNISPPWNIFWGWLLVIMLYSKDLSGRGDVIERRVKTRNDIQWIFINEKSSKDFSRRRLVTLRFISTRSNLRKICRRRWDVIRNFPKTWKCCWKTSPKEKVSSGFYQDEKFPLKNFWKRISFLEIIFKTSNLNQKHSSRRTIDNQILLRDKEMLGIYTFVLVRLTFLIFPLDFTSQCFFRLWRYFGKHVWKIRKTRIRKHQEEEGNLCIVFCCGIM